MAFKTLMPTLSESRGILGDPALSFRWIAFLPTDVYANIGSTVSAGSNGLYVNSAGFMTTPVIPWGRVESFGLPGISIDTDARFGAAGKQHYPRFIDVESCSVTMYEDMNYNSLNYLNNWRNLVVDPYHNYNPANYYKRTVFFYAFDPVNSSVPVLSVELRGAFPTNPGQGLNYEYTSSGMVSIPVTLAVDDVIYQFMPNYSQYSSN